MVYIIRLVTEKVILNFFFFFVFDHICTPFTRKQIALLSYERDVCTRSVVAIFEVSGLLVFCIKVEASR